MADHWTRQARRWTVKAAIPAAIATLSLLLVSGAFAQTPKLGPARIACWSLLVAAGLAVALRQAVRKFRGHRAPGWWTGEACALSAAGADPERQILASVSEIEQSVRGALSVAAAALQPHTAAVYLLSVDGATVRLRDCVSHSERLFRGPLPAREGALGAVLAAGRAVLLRGDGPALSHYEGPAPAHSFCG